MDIVYSVDEVGANNNGIEEEIKTSAVDTSNIDDLEAPTQDTLTSVPVSFSDVEPIEIHEIRDERGRLSDILESIEQDLGISVIPLRMANIAPEVTMLSRHEIYEFGGECYAFSSNIRKNLCEQYVEQVVTCVTEGVPFTLDLVTGITHNGESYKTLLLSRAEWTYIMSRCRTLKQELLTDGNTQMTLTIYAERA